MISNKNVARIETWFEKYTMAFMSEDPEVQGAVTIKREHTFRVVAAAERLARSQDMSENDTNTAKLCALLHDVGRFEQYIKYRTFSDADSENHALLGVKVIRQQAILEGIPDVTASLILRAVACHNRASIPDNDPEETLQFIRLTRDADKIDIWRVFVDHYAKTVTDENRSIFMGLPDLPEFSRSIAADLLAGRIAKTGEMRTLTDFKLLQTGWVYDLNFPESYCIVLEQNYLDRIWETMPQDSEQIRTIYHRALAHVRQNCNRQ